MTHTQKQALEAALAEPEQEPVVRPDGMPTSANERYLRRMLAQRSGIAHIYFDDGEASGPVLGASIDFMRDSVQSIDIKLRELGMQRYMEELQKSPQPREWQELSETTALAIGGAYSQAGSNLTFSEGQFKACIKTISATLRAKNGGAA